MAKQKIWNGTSWEVVGTDAAKVALLDSAGKFAATNVEAAMLELFTLANNGKTSIANAVNSKGVVATSADTFPTLATKIGQIGTGKKFAKGTVTSSATRTQFMLGNGSYYNAFDVTVSGLTFLPSRIIIYKVGQSDITTYLNDVGAYDSGTTDVNNDILTSSNFPRTAPIFRLASPSPAYVNATGFRLPLAGDFTNSLVFNWEAYE